METTRFAYKVKNVGQLLLCLNCLSCSNKRKHYNIGVVISFIKVAYSLENLMYLSYLDVLGGNVIRYFIYFWR